MSAGSPVVSSAWSTPRGDLADLLHGVGLLAVDHVRGSELARQVEPRVDDVDDVDGDDRDSAGDVRGHHGAQPDGASAGDGEGRAGANLWCPPDGASAGLDAAAERADELERGVVTDLDRVAFVGDGVGGERGLGEEPVVDGVARGRVVEGVGAVGTLAGEVHGVEARAAGRQAIEAGPARPAVEEAHRDVVARRHLRHRRADSLDDPGTFVAEDDWQRHGVDLVAVGAAATKGMRGPRGPTLTP